MTGRSMNDIALLLDDLQRQVAAIQRVSGTARGSIIDGAITAYDQDDEPALSIGQQWDGSVTTAELIGPIPPTPTAPTCSPGLSSIAVHWDGLFEPTEDDDQIVAPMDFARVEIHASKDPDFTAEFADTLVGTMESPRGADQLCPLPETGLYYVRLVCRTLPGNAGAPSQQSEVATLILPGTSDSVPPSTSPTPTVTGVINGVFLTWEPTPNVDPVIYRVYADAQPAVQADSEHFVGETTSLGLLVSVRPGDPPTALPYDEDTYFRVVSFDSDGEGPLGAVVHGRPTPATGDAIQTTDLEPPGSSPTPQVLPGLGVLFLRWTAPINNDPLSYRIYASIDPDVPVDTAHLLGEVTGTAFTIKALTDGSPLSYVAPTYVRLVAFDADGPAETPGVVVGAMPLQVGGPDIAVDAVTADKVKAREFTGEVFSGTVVLATTMTTGSIDTEPTSPTFGQVVGQRVTISPEGLTSTDPAGATIVKIPTDPTEAAFIRAKLITDEMQVLGNMSIEGERNTIATGSTLTLGAGLMPPTVAASATPAWDIKNLRLLPATGTLGTFALDFTQIEAVGADVRNSRRMWIAQRRPAAGQYTAGVRLWLYDVDGTVITNASAQPVIQDFPGWSEVRGVWTQTDTTLPHIFGWYFGRWAATVRNPNGGANITNFVPLSGGGRLFRPSMMTRRPSAYYDEARSRLMIAEYNVPQDGGAVSYAKGVRLRGYATAPGFGDDLTISTSRDIALYSPDVEMGSAIGGSDFDYGTTNGIKVAIMYRDSTSPTVVTSLADNAAVEISNGWPVYSAPRVMGWVNGQFITIDKAGQIVQHTDWLFSGSPKVYYGHTWRDSDASGGTPSPPTNDKTHETTLGGKGSVAPARRARLRFTVPAVPDKGGVDDPDSWRLYGVLATFEPNPLDASNSLYRFLTAGTGNFVGFPGTATISRTNPDGFNPPTVNNFPDAAPGRLRSGASSTKYGRAEFEVDGFGGGQWHRIAPPGLCVPYLGVGGDVDLSLILPEVLPGWLRAIGDVASKAAYPALYAIVGDRFNDGTEGVGFFRLPDMRDRTPLGAGAILLGQNEGAAYADRNDRWSHLHAHAAGNLTTDGPTTTVNHTPRSTGSDNAASPTHGHQVKNSTATAASPRHPFLGVTFIVKT